MNTTIFTVAYDKDLEFLKYNLKSINKFCEGFYKNIVLLDNNNSERTADYLEKIGQPYFIDDEASLVNKGYVRQQYIKLIADRYMPENCDFICHVDCDGIFINQQCASDYFKNGKPIILKNSYKNIYNILRRKREPKRAERDVAAFNVWQETTSAFVGFDVEYEYMQLNPFIYPIGVQTRVREYLEKIHSKPLIDIIKNQDILSEYNIIGAYCEKFEKEKFHWVDREDQEDFSELVKKRRSLFGQYSNRELDQPDRYVDLSKKNNIISNLFD